MAEGCKKSRHQGGRGRRRMRGGQPTPRKPRPYYPTHTADGMPITKYTQPRRRGTMSFYLPISLMGGYRPHGNYAPGAGAIVYGTDGRRGKL